MSHLMHDSFFNKVYAVVRQIPPGRVTSYGAIAKFLGTGKSARVVGWAMNNSHKSGEFIPAQRVVNRNGLLTGKHHFGTPGLMQQLLENEGVTVREDCVQNFTSIFWDPSKELRK